MVIVNDSCTSTIRVSFLNAPDVHNVYQYKVTLLPDGELTCDTDICDKFVQHVSAMLVQPLKR